MERDSHLKRNPNRIEIETQNLKGYMTRRIYNNSISLRYILLNYIIEEYIIFFFTQTHSRSA